MRKVEFYDRKGRLLKILQVSEVFRDGDYWTLNRLIMENVQRSHKTVLDLSNVTYDSSMEDDFFTERFLRRRQ